MTLYAETLGSMVRQHVERHARFVSSRVAPGYGPLSCILTLSFDVSVCGLKYWSLLDKISYNFRAGTDSGSRVHSKVHGSEERCPGDTKNHAGAPQKLLRSGENFLVAVLLGSVVLHHVWMIVVWISAILETGEETCEFQMKAQDRRNPSVYDC